MAFKGEDMIEYERDGRRLKPVEAILVWIANADSGDLPSIERLLFRMEIPAGYHDQIIEAWRTACRTSRWPWAERSVQKLVEEILEQKSQFDDSNRFLGMSIQVFFTRERFVHAGIPYKYHLPKIKWGLINGLDKYFGSQAASEEKRPYLLREAVAMGRNRLRQHDGFFQLSEVAIDRFEAVLKFYGITLPD